MRRSVLLTVPALLILTACGSKGGKLTPEIAEKLIAPDYPVIVPIKVPKVGKAKKGSAEHTKIDAINALLAKGGAFKIDRQESGDQITWTYEPLPGAKDIVAGDQTWLIPAAEGTYVKATRIEPKDGNWLVRYQIRLTKPTAHFPLFQLLHPNAKIGDTKDRHARIERKGNEWGLLKTDEDFKPKR